MKSAEQRRRILHVDMAPFFVAVERGLAPELRDAPLIVGGGGASGFVAAASAEAAAQGVRPGQRLAEARRLCPEGVVRPGDFEAYARASESVTALLLHYSRRVERPSADEAYLDLSPSADAARPVAAAEGLKDELRHRLGLEAALGLASSRLAARVASARARPRGLLVVLPGYEAAFIGGQPVDGIPGITPSACRRLEAEGLSTIADVAAADPALLDAIVGPALGPRLYHAARGEHEKPIEHVGPPSTIHEDLTIRARGSRREDLETLLDGLAERAASRLRREGLATGGLSVEVRRERGWSRRSENVQPALESAKAIAAAARGLAGPLLEPAGGVRALGLRLSRFERPSAEQVPLFPGAAGS